MSENNQGYDYKRELEQEVGYEPRDNPELLADGEKGTRSYEFKVDISETEKWFIENDYLTLGSGYDVIDSNPHSHSGCESGSTGSTSLNPIRVEDHRGVIVKRVRVSHVPSDTPAEPIYPDLISVEDLGDVGYSLSKEE